MKKVDFKSLLGVPDFYLCWIWSFYFYFKIKSKRKTFRIRLYSYYKKYKNLGKKFTIDHFISEWENRTTFMIYINLFASGKNAKHKFEGGWSAKILNVCPKENSLVALMHTIICKSSYWEYGNTKIQGTKDSKQKRSTKGSQ